MGGRGTRGRQLCARLEDIVVCRGKGWWEVVTGPDPVFTYRGLFVCGCTFQPLSPADRLRNPILDITPPFLFLPRQSNNNVMILPSSFSLSRESPSPSFQILLQRRCLYCAYLNFQQILIILSWGQFSPSTLINPTRGLGVVRSPQSLGPDMSR